MPRTLERIEALVADTPRIEEKRAARIEERERGRSDHVEDARGPDRAEQLFMYGDEKGKLLTMRRIEYLLKKEFEVSNSTARKYLRIARARCAKASEGVNREALVEQTSGMFLDAYNTARDK